MLGTGESGGGGDAHRLHVVAVPRGREEEEGLPWGVTVSVGGSVHGCKHPCAHEHPCA